MCFLSWREYGFHTSNSLHIILLCFGNLLNLSSELFEICTYLQRRKGTRVFAWWKGTGCFLLVLHGPWIESLSLFTVAALSFTLFCCWSAITAQLWVCVLLGASPWLQIPFQSLYQSDLQPFRQHHFRRGGWDIEPQIIWRFGGLGVCFAFFLKSVTLGRSGRHRLSVVHRFLCSPNSNKEFASWEAIRRGGRSLGHNPGTALGKDGSWGSSLSAFQILLELSGNKDPRNQGHSDVWFLLSAFSLEFFLFIVCS